MTFCDVRGMTMLVQAGATAAERGVGYAVAAAPRQVRQVWPKLWPAAELPVQYPSAAAGVLAYIGVYSYTIYLAHGVVFKLPYLDDLMMPSKHPARPPQQRTATTAQPGARHLREAETSDRLRFIRSDYRGNPP